MNMQPRLNEAPDDDPFTPTVERIKIGKATLEQVNSALRRHATRETQPSQLFDQHVEELRNLTAIPKQLKTEFATETPQPSDAELQQQANDTHK